MTRNTAVILFAVSILGWSVVGCCAQSAAPPKTESVHSIQKSSLPTYSYPNIPKYYPNIEDKAKIELLLDAKDEQEIVAWADKNRFPRVMKPGDVKDMLLVFTNISGKRIVFSYGYSYTDSADSKPWKLQQAKPVDGISVFDDLSCVCLSKDGLVCKSSPKTIFKPGYDYTGGQYGSHYHYPFIPKSYGWTEIRGKHEVIDVLPRANNRQELVKWANSNGLSYYLQLDEPFNRLFLVLSPFGFSSIDYDAYLYGNLGKGTEPWTLLYVGKATSFFTGNYDSDDLKFGLCAYVDKMTRNLVFCSSKGVAYGTVNIENELKLIYGDQYEAVMSENKPK